MKKVTDVRISLISVGGAYIAGLWSGNRAAGALRAAGPASRRMNMAEWLTRHGDHPLHDMEARYLVEYAAPLDAESAAAWAGHITDPALRAEAERLARPEEGP
jgi:hypothetical protein